MFAEWKADAFVAVDMQLRTEARRLKGPNAGLEAARMPTQPWEY